MKRAIWLIILVTSNIFVYSQKAPDFKISVDDYKKAATLKDLIKTMPKDCKILKYEVSTPVKGILVSATAAGDSIKWNRDKAEPGNKVFITISSSTCKKKMRTEYKIILE